EDLDVTMTPQGQPRRQFIRGVNTRPAPAKRFPFSDPHGTEKQVEADLTRYSVVFTGEKLPNGKNADAVYIVLTTVLYSVVMTGFGVQAMKRWGSDRNLTGVSKA
ncbi:MAG: hypothetical protein ABIZ80_20705, partial [Bryobacteraceae bacterium]